MKRLACALLACAACIDFDAAKQQYCAVAAQQHRSDVCGLDGGSAGGGSGGGVGGGGTGGGGPRDAGDGTHLLAEAADAGALEWGVRYGGPGDERAADLALTADGGIVVVGTFTGMADLGTGPLTSAGARDFFVARYASSGAAQKLQVGSGPGDDELASVACAGAAGCFVGGTLKGPIAFGGGVFDAGAQGAAFIARVDSSGVGAWLQLDSADGGASSITRVRARGGDAGFALVVTGSFTGELSAAGTHVDDSSGRRGFVLALDEGLGVHGQASASIACDLSDFSDVGFDGAGAAIIFGTMHGDLGCKVGGGPGGSPFDMPTGTGFFVNIDAPGFLSSGNSVSVVPVGADFTVHGAYARNSVVMAYTRGSAGSGAASLFLEGRPSVDVTAFESVATTVAAAPGGRVYAAFSYRGEMGNTLDFGTPLPARSSLSPLVFSRLPGMSADWHRTFFAEGGDAFVRAGAVSADDAYVAAGDFSGSFGTDAQLLRTDGGSDLFLLKLR